MKCRYCGNPLPAECKFCPACGASVGKSDGAAADGRATGKIEYSDKKLSVFLMKNLVFGRGYFYIGRLRLGALVVLLGVMFCFFATQIALTNGMSKGSKRYQYYDYDYHRYYWRDGRETYVKYHVGEGIVAGVAVFLPVYLLQLFGALLVKTDGDGKKLR